MACSVKYCFFCNVKLKERIVIKQVQLLINVVKEKKKKEFRNLQSKQRTCQNIIGREMTTLLKIAVDNVILELCGLCDYSASLYSWKKQLNLIMTFKKRHC